MVLYTFAHSFVGFSIAEKAQGGGGGGHLLYALLYKKTE